MPHHYQDFSATDLVVMQGAVRDAGTALIKVKAALAKAKPINPNSDTISDLETRFKKWFGPFTDANVGLVEPTVTALRNAVMVSNLWIKSCTLNENLNPGGVPDIACPPNENASAVPSVGVVGFAASRVRAGYQNSIYICPRMLRSMASRGTDEQSIAGTLIHELSHAAGGTVDAVQNGVTVYGSAAAKALVKSAVGSNATAFQNAENYGFFCMEFL